MASTETYQAIDGLDIPVYFKLKGLLVRAHRNNNLSESRLMDVSLASEKCSV